METVQISRTQIQEMHLCSDCERKEGRAMHQSIAMLYQIFHSRAGHHSFAEQMLRAQRETCDLCCATYKGLDHLGQTGYKVEFGNDIRHDVGNFHFFYQSSSLHSSTVWDLYTDIGDTASPWPEIRQLKHIPEDPFGSATLTTLRTWIEKCEQGHPRCAAAKDRVLPSRVIDVGSETDFRGLRLYVSEGEPGNYMTLSYRWGNYIGFNTTSHNVAERLQSMSFASFPPLFQQAIIVTRGLRLRYLWIDAVCIIQDDPMDWEKEAACMAQTYGCSSLTLWASCASSPAQPLACKRPASLSFRHKDRHGRDYIFYIRQANFHEIARHDSARGGHSGDLAQRYPNVQRAWCFQEWYLSPRIVHHTEREMIWQCYSMSECECGDIKETGQHSGRGDYLSIQRGLHVVGNGYGRSIDFVKDWANILTGYTSNELSHEEEILPALSGIARQVSQAGAGEYLAGLWRNGLEWQLTWRRPFTQRAAPTKYRAPSFSPLACAGRVEWFAMSGAPSTITVLEAKCVPAGIDATGRVSSGYLSVSGPILEVYIQSVKEGLGRKNGLVQCTSNLGTRYEICWDADSLENWEIIQPGNAVYLLQVTEYVFLVLQAIHGRKHILEMICNAKNRICEAIGRKRNHASDENETYKDPISEKTGAIKEFIPDDEPAKMRIADRANSFHVKQILDISGVGSKHVAEKTSTDVMHVVDKTSVDGKHLVDNTSVGAKDMADKTCLDGKYLVDTTCIDVKYLVDKASMNMKLMAERIDKKHMLNRMGIYRQQTYCRIGISNRVNMLANSPSDSNPANTYEHCARLTEAAMKIITIE